MTPPTPKRPGAATPGAQHTAKPHEAADETPPGPPGNGAHAAPPAPGRHATTDFRTQPRGPQAEQTTADTSPYSSTTPEAPYGASAPEAERTAAEGTGRHSRSPGASPYDAPLPEAERTVTDRPGGERPGVPPYGGPGSSVPGGPAGAGMPPYSPPVAGFPTPDAERTAATGMGLPPYGPPGTGFPTPDPNSTAASGGLDSHDTGTPPYSAPGSHAPDAGGTGTGGPYGEMPGVPGTGGTAGSDAGPRPGDPGFPSQDAGSSVFPGARVNGPAEANADEPASGPRAPSPGTPTAEAGGQKFSFQDGQLTLALAKFGPGASSATPGPELTPDAILPPGTPPEAPPEPPHDLGETATGPIPRLGSGASFPGGPGMAPPGGDHEGSSGARRALLVAGGLVAALVLGGGGALAVTTLSGSSGDEHKVVQPPPPPPATTHPAPTPTPSKTKAKHKPKAVPVDIRDEKKDPKPLTVVEVFPHSTLTLAKNKFLRAKTVINDQCSLTANGPFAAELTREHCRRVVRATFVSDDKKLAVTTGVAVMPTDAAARAALKAQDPAHYKWFRGMKATGAPKIDQAGGYAASTLRGRYIIYAYATYADGHKPADDDKTLKTVGTAFRDSTARPIERRDKKH
ncbi:MAG TPA: hypothetical protein VE198_12250 [Actinoallomurus sp.]|nr:hypothetical protein [Actinoallomurus sp.]